MSEIEKMYENAGIKKQYCGWLDMGDLDTQMTYIQCDTKEEWDECVFMSRNEYYNKPKMEYPPFTAEKQLELIKWLIQKYKTILIEHKLNLFYINIRDIYTGMVHIEFDETIAGLFNNLWQDLTETEQEQIRSIFNGN